ncbi:MAG: bifunctional demethylmenaquinone methyltransferase/2-methoxy-6-polyprenyl-1,4-benzoquinol methylase UbiE [Bacteroidales bacterium]|nr:bifunctional demethylmenaquinone methyltransferase/2-methoxy-6-polyprenyl-1,4-benzoquinol methylase UbiE [Bacteroidales bacterium]
MEISELFDNISGTYDKLNHMLSLGIDKVWRRRSLRGHIGTGSQVLDVACGSGDFSFLSLREGAKEVTGVDISEKMLEVARRKLKGHLSNLQHGQEFQQKISFQYGDCSYLPFDRCMFDTVTIAFGVRNFSDLHKGLSEIHRVLKPGGEVIILEFSTPKYFPVKQFYKIYFKRILPYIGGKVSGNKGAYEYLPESVYKFPQGKEFEDILSDLRFENITSKRHSLGISTTYYGFKCS